MDSPAAAAVCARPFGRLLAYDPDLRAAHHVPLTLRGHHPHSLSLFSGKGRLVTVASAAAGRGPDRLLAERLPAPTPGLPQTGWTLTPEGLALADELCLPFVEGRAQPSHCLTPLRDLPGHFHRRVAQGEPADEWGRRLGQRLEALFTALGTAEAEAIEKPVLDLVGFGPGLTPAGDDALAGLILTARAFLLGRRYRVDWLSRLVVQVLRLLHRTTEVSACYLRFAVAGRTTALQEELFLAMSRDLHTQNELVIEKMRAFGGTSGSDFLRGVRLGLDMVKARLEQPFNTLMR